jgi:hypothetical protein
LIGAHHDLGYTQGTGEQLKYVVTLAERPDRFIGWNDEARRKNLPLLVNNHRFLILPQINLANLASWILAHVTRRLRADWQTLKDKLRSQQRQSDEGYFGSSTPSSKKPFKANPAKGGKRKNGGAREGHRGYGRSTFTPEEADEVITLETEELCPHCHAVLVDAEQRDRSVLEIVPVQVKKVLCFLQYCYSHLLRLVQDLGKEFPQFCRIPPGRDQLVIARKVSFGSQADAGAKTREILMTTLLTLKKRKAGEVYLNLKAALDQLACDPKSDVYEALFFSGSS